MGKEKKRKMMTRISCVDLLAPSSLPGPGGEGVDVSAGRPQEEAAQGPGRAAAGQLGHTVPAGRLEEAGKYSWVGRTRMSNIVHMTCYFKTWSTVCGSRPNGNWYNF